MAFMKDIAGAYLVVFALLFFSMFPLLGWFTCKVLTYPQKTFVKWIFGGIMMLALPLASTIASFFPMMDGFGIVGLIVLFFLGLNSALWCIPELLLRKFKNNTTSKKYPPLFWFILWLILVALIILLPLCTAFNIADNGVKSGNSDPVFIFSYISLFLSPIGVLAGICVYVTRISVAFQIKKQLGCKGTEKDAHNQNALHTSDEPKPMISQEQTHAEPASTD